MATRARLVAGNWKMHGSRVANEALLAEVAAGAVDLPGVEIVVCPPFTAAAVTRVDCRATGSSELGSARSSCNRIHIDEHAPALPPVNAMRCGLANRSYMLMKRALPASDCVTAGLTKSAADCARQ